MTKSQLMALAVFALVVTRVGVAALISGTGQQASHERISPQEAAPAAETEATQKPEQDPATSDQAEPCPTNRLPARDSQIDGSIVLRRVSESSCGLPAARRPRRRDQHPRTQSGFCLNSHTV